MAVAKGDTSKVLENEHKTLFFVVDVPSQLLAVRLGKRMKLNSIRKFY